MRSRSRLLLLALLLVAGTVAMAWDASAQEPVTSRFKLSIGGYIKAEALYKTNSGGFGFAGSIPGTQNFGFTAVPQHNTAAGENGQFNMLANETRFQFTINAPDWRGLKSLGYLEMDFDGDNVNTITRYGGVAPPAGIGNPQGGGIQNGGFRIRHAFLRLAGEGLGGSWSVLFGQAWETFGMLPFYGGSSLSFGGATIFGGRSPQLTLRHDLRLFRDFTLQTTIGAHNDWTQFNEVPRGEISGRLIYSGWQGFQGGSRTPLNLGISAMVGRQKADVQTAIGGAVGSFSFPSQRALSNTAWGFTGGIFLPILPGRSATDRTFALSAVSEAGYGEGVNTLIPGANPLGGMTVGAPNRGDPGSAFFKPGSCAFVIAPTLIAAAGTNPCAGAAPAGSLMLPTELSLVKAAWTSWNVQFYLPAGFWISGGQKWVWFSNADNALAQTCINGATPAACGAGAGLVTPVNQGRWNTHTAAGINNVQGGAAAGNLLAGRDAQLKRLHYNYVAAFYDMTPNIRLGFEWGMHGTNRKDSDQDNQSHRFQVGAYYFF